MFIVGLVMMVGGIGFCLVTLNLSLKAFRKLVDFQFQNYNDLWIADGRPKGGKVTSDELSFSGSDLSAVPCAVSWAISRPRWLTPGSAAERFRVEMIRWFLVFLVGFIIEAGGLALFVFSIDKTG